jgi:hypothetical protein
MMFKRDGVKFPNSTLNAETAHVGISTFSIFSIIRSSVSVRYAQFRSAQRWAAQKI